MHKVAKTLHFSYGHRLINYSGKCKNLHGHNAKVEILIESQKLNPKGMVFDFGEIKKKLKKWIDQNWDHRMLLAKEDPLLPTIKKIDKTVVTLPFNPTAENLAKALFQKSRKLGLPVSEISFWETETSRASYSEI